MICNKALKITNKDIIYAQLDSGYSDNLELNLYLKFGNEERHVGNISLPIDFDLNLKWYEIDEVKGLISDLGSKKKFRFWYKKILFILNKFLKHR